MADGLYLPTLASSRERHMMAKLHFERSSDSQHGVLNAVLRLLLARPYSFHPQPFQRELDTLGWPQFLPDGQQHSNQYGRPARYVWMRWASPTATACTVFSE